MKILIPRHIHFALLAIVECGPLLKGWLWSEFCVHHQQVKVESGQDQYVWSGIQVWASGGEVSASGLAC